MYILATIISIVLINIIFQFIPYLFLIYVLVLAYFNIQLSFIVYTSVSIFIAIMCSGICIRFKNRKDSFSNLKLNPDELSIATEHFYYIYFPQYCVNIAALCAVIQITSMALIGIFYLKQQFLYMIIVFAILLYYTLKKLRIKLNPIWCMQDYLVNLYNHSTRIPDNHKYKEILINKANKVLARYRLLLNVLNKYDEAQLVELENQLRTKVINDLQYERSYNRLKKSNEMRESEYLQINSLFL